MIAWLRRFASSIAIGVLAFLAYRAAQQVSGHKQSADRWKQVAVDAEESDIAESLVSAKAAMTQAKKHEAEADRIKQKAEERIAKVATSDDTISDIVDRWRAG